MDDWITLTLAVNGYQIRIRRNAVISYGVLPRGGPCINLAGKTIEVRESQAELAALVGDDPDWEGPAGDK
jgi:hypothetical protein